MSLVTRVARSATLAAAGSALLAAVATSTLGGILLQQEEDRRLYEAARDLVYLLADTAPGAEQISAILRHEHEETEHAGMHFRVSTAAGAYIAGELQNETVEVERCATLGHAQLRICSVETPTGLIVTAAAAHAHRTVLFFVAALVAATFSGLATWLWSLPMARSAIAPLSRLRARVAAIDIDAAERAELGPPERVLEVDELRKTIDQLLGRVGIALAQAQRFAANAAHELRTPLTAMRAELELCGEHATLPEEVTGNIATAQSKLSELVLLVERLLILAKPKQRPSEPSEVVSLQDVIEDVVRGLAPNHAVEMALPGGDTLVRGDALLLGTMFANALNNGVKFGGRVEVTLQVAEAFAIIRVDDDGPGLDESERERVFEPFYRGQDALRHRHPGHGLGLALVRHIAEGHGGRASFQPRSAPGARLEIQLPLLQPERRPARA